MSALSGVSLTAMPDEARGVYGRSGAGKSILLRVMAGIESPDSGRIESHGSSAMSYAEPRLDDAMTPKETLELHCALYGIPRRKRRSAIRDTLVLLDLESVCDRRISVLTSGERKQLELARVLISPSPTLLLDEPMAGLDGMMRERVWNHLLMLKSAEHRTIVVATARAEDAELCDRIAVLHYGKILADGTVSHLRGMIGPEVVVIRPLNAGRPGGRGTWADKRAITMSEHDGSVVVDMSAESTPADLLAEISGQAAGVRLSPRSLNVVLEELIARSTDRTEG